MKIAALLIVIGLGAGCASSASEGWTKPGATEEQVNRDAADCLFNVQSVVPGGSQGPRFVINQDRHRQCMANRGYTAGAAK